MSYRNTKTGYGLVSRILHWGMALAIFGLFVLGYWMRTLTYGSPFYQSAPELHEGLGMVLLGLLVFRLIWKLINTDPDTSELTKTERLGSVLMHWGFYAILFVMMAAGYFILTLNGRPFSFFGLFDIPSIYSQPAFPK